MSTKYVQTQPFTLYGSGATTGDTTVVLSSMLQIDGTTTITMSDFGSKGFATIEPGSGTREEQISFTGITQNADGTATLTGVSTVLMVSPYTETSGLAQSHTGGVILVISNTSGYYNTFANKNDDETIVGLWTFPNDASTPLIGASYIAPTLDTQVASKKYVDDVAVAGAPDANTTTKGIVQIPTQAQVDAGTATGSTGASLTPTPDLLRSKLLSDYVADTGAADAYVITPSPAISAYATGQIFSFKAANANTTTSTLNVNAKGTKTIKKGDGATDLTTGDIAAGQIVVVEYDGTNFQVISPINLVSSGTIQMSGASSAPTGWLLCDGTSYVRTDYPSLFSVLGTTYGSADSSHFNVPDLRGRSPIGVGTGTGGGASGTGLPSGGSALTAVSRATWKGEETHTLTTPEMPAHTHNVGGNIFVPESGGGTPLEGVGSTDTASSSTGGDGAHNNIQPVLGVNFLIKI